MSRLVSKGQVSKGEISRISWYIDIDIDIDKNVPLDMHSYKVIDIDMWEF